METQEENIVKMAVGNAKEKEQLDDARVKASMEQSESQRKKDNTGRLNHNPLSLRRVNHKLPSECVNFDIYQYESPPKTPNEFHSLQPFYTFGKVLDRILALWLLYNESFKLLKSIDNRPLVGYMNVFPELKDSIWLLKASLHKGSAFIGKSYHNGYRTCGDAFREGDRELGYLISITINLINFEGLILKSLTEICTRIQSQIFNRLHNAGTWRAKLDFEELISVSEKGQAEVVELLAQLSGRLHFEWSQKQAPSRLIDTISSPSFPIGEWLDDPVLSANTIRNPKSQPPQPGIIPSRVRCFTCSKQNSLKRLMQVRYLKISQLVANIEIRLVIFPIELLPLGAPDALSRQQISILRESLITARLKGRRMMTEEGRASFEKVTRTGALDLTRDPLEIQNAIPVLVPAVDTVLDSLSGLASVQQIRESNDQQSYPPIQGRKLSQRGPSSILVAMTEDDTLVREIRKNHEGVDNESSAEMADPSIYKSYEILEKGVHQPQYYPVNRSAYYPPSSFSSTSFSSNTGAYQSQYHPKPSPSSFSQFYNPMQRFENESVREQSWIGISEFQAMEKPAKTERKSARKERKGKEKEGKGWSSWVKSPVWEGPNESDLLSTSASTTKQEQLDINMGFKQIRPDVTENIIRGFLQAGPTDPNSQQKFQESYSRSKFTDGKFSANSYGLSPKIWRSVPSLSAYTLTGLERNSFTLPKPVIHIPLGKDLHLADRVERGLPKTFKSFQEFMAMENVEVTGGIQKLDVNEKDAKIKDDLSVVPQGFVESGSQIRSYNNVLAVDSHQKESVALTQIDKSFCVRRGQGAEASLIDPKIEDLYAQPRKSQSGEVKYTSADELIEPQPEDPQNRSNSMNIGSTRISEPVSFTSPGTDTFSAIPTASIATKASNDRFACLHPGCVRSSSRSSDLQRHMRKHDTSTKLFNCNVKGCKYNGAKGFYRRDKLVSHQRKRHGMHKSGEVKYASTDELTKPQLEDSPKDSVIVCSTRGIEHNSKATLFAHEAPKKHSSTKSTKIQLALVTLLTFLEYATFAPFKRWLTVTWRNRTMSEFYVISSSWLGLGCILVSMGVSNPPINPGKKRLFWTCRCGYQSYDDFLELRSGAVKRYESQLREHLNPRDDTKGSGSFSGLFRGLRMLGFAFGKNNNDKPNNQSSLPQFNTTEQPGNGGLPTTAPLADSLYLLLCIPHRKYATKLIQPELQHICTDQSFFNLLRENYRGLRGRVRYSLSLKTLKQIKFVQFEMYKSQLVDIRKQDDIPPEDKKDEYRYRPIPAEIIPPIGENMMMHLCSHPEDADDVDALCLDRIPKKLRDRLLVCPTKGTGLGWGIHFIEGWHYNIIWLLAFVLLLLASLVFLICWGALQHDLQGASGVAAYMLAFVTLFIGSIQALFELS
ncbi:MAG: hypothetical protein Q9187_005307 [Circinaria calcarea]